MQKEKLEPIGKIQDLWMNEFIVPFLDQIKINCIAPVCIRCGSYFPSLMFCCKTCSQFLLYRFENFKTETDPSNRVSVSSLIDWPPNASASLSTAVHLLKLASAKPAWKFLAAKFVEQLVENIDVSTLKTSETILVPVPGHKPGSTHTEYFAQSLSDLLGIPKINLLNSGQFENHDQPAEQKKLNKRQRLSRQSNFYVDFTKLNNLDNVKNLILIDDIVTTGATLVSCVDIIKRDTKLLKQAELHAWVLFKRTENSLER